MKEHLRSYFPERFEDSEPGKFGYKLMNMLDGFRIHKERMNCERKVAYIFQQSDELKLLAGAMKKYGCNFNLLRHVVCETCNNCHGGFDPDTKQIIVCQNRNLSDNRVMSTIMHEMVHMFDYCRVKFDFDNIDHVACSEIRAANLTYCSILDRIMHGGPGIFNFKNTHQYCVKDIAFQSIKAYSPDTPDEDLWKVIYKVFPQCYNDLEPFGRRPTSGVRELKHSYRERYHYGYVY